MISLLLIHVLSLAPSHMLRLRQMISLPLKSRAQSCSSKSHAQIPSDDQPPSESDDQPPIKSRAQSCSKSHAQTLSDDQPSSESDDQPPSISDTQHLSKSHAQDVSESDDQLQITVGKKSNNPHKE